jgi:hypothetical protein
MLAGFEAAVLDRAILVRRFDAVARIARLVELEEEFLGVAIQSALPGLIRRDLDEGVVATFLAHAQLKDAQVSAERP